MEKGLLVSISIGVAAAVGYYAFTRRQQRRLQQSQPRLEDSSAPLLLTNGPDKVSSESEKVTEGVQAGPEPPQDSIEEGTASAIHPNTPAEPLALQRFEPSTAQINYGRFKDHYEKLSLLGRGACSAVYKCNHLATGEDRAVKIIDLRKLQVSQRFREERVLEEVRILQSLQHPNIVQIFDVFKSDGHLYIVMEYAKGGELFDSIVSAGNFGEEAARYIMHQALSAVQYLHSKGIVHRDLKPENVLVVDDPEDKKRDKMFTIKVADFGVARHVGDRGAQTFVGTPYYCAPEVLTARDTQATYGPEVDVWSLGVLAYVLLCGYLPFEDGEGERDEAAEAKNWEQRVLSGAVEFAPPVWTHVSDDAKDFVRSMLTVDPSKRPAAALCLRHPWLSTSRVPPLPRPSPEEALVRSTAGAKGAASLEYAQQWQLALRQQEATSLQFSPEFPIQDLPSAYIPVAPLQTTNSDKTEKPDLWSGFVGPGIGPQGKRGWSWEQDGGEENGVAVGDTKRRFQGASEEEEKQNVLDNDGHQTSLLVSEVDFRRLVGVQRAIARLFERATDHLREIPNAEEVVVTHANVAKSLVEECVKTMTAVQFTSYTVFSILPQWQRAMIERDVVALQHYISRLRYAINDLHGQSRSMYSQLSNLHRDLQATLQQAAQDPGWFSSVLLASQLEGTKLVTHDDRAVGQRPVRIRDRRNSDSSVSSSPTLSFLQPSKKQSFLTPDPTSSPSPPTSSLEPTFEDEKELRGFELGTNASGRSLKPDDKYQLSPTGRVGLHRIGHSYESGGLLERQATFESSTSSSCRSSQGGEREDPSRHDSSYDRDEAPSGAFSLVPSVHRSGHPRRNQRQDIALFLAQTTALTSEWCRFWSHFQVNLTELLASHEFLNSLFFSDNSVQFHHKVSDGVRRIGTKWQTLKEASSAYLSSATNASLSNTFEFLRSLKMSKSSVAN